MFRIFLPTICDAPTFTDIDRHESLGRHLTLIFKQLETTDLHLWTFFKKYFNIPYFSFNQCSLCFSWTILAKGNVWSSHRNNLSSLSYSCYSAFRVLSPVQQNVNKQKEAHWGVTKAGKVMKYLPLKGQVEASRPLSPRLENRQLQKDPKTGP